MCACVRAWVCVSPVPQATGPQVGVVTVLETTFDQLVQGVVQQRLVLCVDVLYPLMYGGDSQSESRTDESSV